MNTRLSGLFLVLVGASLSGCGSEPQPDGAAQTDTGDVAADATTDVTPNGCTTPDPSQTCQDTECDEGHECVLQPNGCTPSSCSCSDGSWECTEDCGPSYICTTETSPQPSCGSLTDRGECGGAGICEWFEPAGCPEPNTYVLQTATCFPQVRCQADSECPSGYYCEDWASVAPRCAWEEPLCDSCGETRPLCLPIE